MTKRQEAVEAATGLILEGIVEAMEAGLCRSDRSYEATMDDHGYVDTVTVLDAVDGTAAAFLRQVGLDEEGFMAAITAAEDFITDAMAGA
ncbi:hypothetical protein [Devosia faecipullorum]|uniref:hypothetical protein n=1 Tax=Devosia faecipullorum TaxID=2755039 RepID=UPI00187BA92C|nr:hypothetical protein [Devosia faecipullorum]MBE7731462.1 hypothetical protein [Devosia faecipullorum]